MNMKMFNRGCKFQARPFKLPLLEGVAVLLKDLDRRGERGGAAWGGGGANTIRVAAHGCTYTRSYGCHSGASLDQ